MRLIDWYFSLSPTQLHPLFSCYSFLCHVHFSHGFYHFLTDGYLLSGSGANDGNCEENQRSSGRIEACINYPALISFIGVFYRRFLLLCECVNTVDRESLMTLKHFFLISYYCFSGRFKIQWFWWIHFRFNRIWMFEISIWWIYGTYYHTVLLLWERTPNTYIKKKKNSISGCPLFITDTSHPAKTYVNLSPLAGATGHWAPKQADTRTVSPQRMSHS